MKWWQSNLFCDALDVYCLSYRLRNVDGPWKNLKIQHWYRRLRIKAKVLGRTRDPVQFSCVLIPRGLNQDQTRTSAVRNQRVTTWAKVLSRTFNDIIRGYISSNSKFSAWPILPVWSSINVALKGSILLTSQNLVSSYESYPRVFCVRMHVFAQLRAVTVFFF